MAQARHRVEALIDAAQTLSRAMKKLRFTEPVTHVYNPLAYAWPMHEAYLRRYGSGPKRVVFVGMNPGPWGMAQTGVPFGEVAHVRDWLDLDEPIDSPKHEHPKRPVRGLACERSEVSGRRLWGLFAERFGTPDAFFADHFVANYCPLVFMEAGGRNRTPDKLPAAERGPMASACDRHLQQVIDALSPQVVVGVGGFAFKKAKAVLNGSTLRVEQVLHPSPASPAANRGWATQATEQLIDAGVWDTGG
ncbi:MAG: single-stranded DNA-binding protein [Planctomycetes bacterium]|jgi:single-strand selective monofunctional uracil DNA glycosylase|nr:single-stranded DNA-binding protein [Planctomycetota bacterium]